MLEKEGREPLLVISEINFWYKTFSKVWELIYEIKIGCIMMYSRDNVNDFNYKQKNVKRNDTCKCCYFTITV